MESVKNRSLESGQTVEVYYNLHKHVYSIKDKQTGLVVAHAKNVTLENVVFKVSEKGRQRVLRKRQKNVHARVVGTFVSANCEPDDFSSMKTAFYNPYFTDSFTDKEELTKIHQAKIAHCADKIVYYH